MQKKKNTRLRLDDALVVVVCLTVATLSLLQFSNRLNGIIGRFDEKQIATITYKYNSAQRRPDKRAVWDYLRQESPLYDADTIRTADLAEATVNFIDGGKIDLAANTIVQVFARREGSSIGLKKGTLVVTSDGSGPMTVSSGKTTVEVSGQAALVVPGVLTGEKQDGGVPTLTERGFDITVLSGDVRLDAAGTTSTLGGGEHAAFMPDGQPDMSPAIAVTSPAPNARFLAYSSNTIPVIFSWSPERIAPDAEVIFETADDSGFDKPTFSKKVTGSSKLAINLPVGICRWRLYARTAGSDSTPEKAGTEAIAAVREGTVTVIDAARPALTAPFDAAEYAYRDRLPRIDFSWSGAESAIRWQLVIADNPDMDHPVEERSCVLPSATVDGLAAGIWYWQVRPVYSSGEAEPEGFSKVRRLSVAQTDSIAAPVPICPQAEKTVDTAAAIRSNGLNFSWKPATGAAAYIIRIADNPGMNDPLIETTVTGNLYTLIPANRLGNGRRYWTVCVVAADGTRSPSSLPVSFMAVDGEILRRVVFPPDGYAIADNLLPDTRFVWETNQPGGTRFQVASRPDFAECSIDEPVAGETAQVRQLPNGSWYWRISGTADGSANSTPARTFSVVPPLDRPQAIAPLDSECLVVRPDQPGGFSWRPVKQAEFYRIRIMKAGADERPLLERNFTTETKIEVDVSGWEEGSYRWTLQAMASETDRASRRIGGIAEYRFDLRKLRPAELREPADNALFDGIEAILHPLELVWSSALAPALSRLVIAGNPAELAVAGRMTGSRRAYGDTPGSIIAIDRPTMRFCPDGLAAGTYYWTIIAETQDGLDISAVKPRSFTIAPIPSLPAPGNLSPLPGGQIGIEYLAANRSMTFAWDEVPGATEYRFAIRTLVGAIIAETTTDKTKYAIDDLSLLDQGTFVWTVEARRRIGETELYQPGLIGKSDFSISLPEMSAPKKRTREILYGQ